MNIILLSRFRQRLFLSNEIRSKQFIKISTAEDGGPSPWCSVCVPADPGEADPEAKISDCATSKAQISSHPQPAGRNVGIDGALQTLPSSASQLAVASADAGGREKSR